MTNQELKLQIETFFQDKNLGLELKLIYSFGNVFYNYKPALEEDQLNKTLLYDFTNELKRTFITNDEDDEFEVEDINVGEATDKHTIYHIEPSRIPKINRVFNAADLDLDPEHQFKKEKLSSIWGMVITIGNSTRKLEIFKRNFPVNVIKKTSTHQVFFRRGALKIVDEDLLKINSKIDFFLLNNSAYIINKKEFENSFDYIEAMQREATSKVDFIMSANVIEDEGRIYDLIKKKNTLKKILNISNANPILSVAPKRIASFSRKYKLGLGLNEDESRIAITNKKSAEVFIKLLNDDYLISEMSKFLYDSRGKKKIH